MGLPDVDLDVIDRNAVMEVLPALVHASQVAATGVKLMPHNTGVYFQNVPTDPLTGLATFPYDMAEELGYYKIDFIPFHIYEMVRDEQHLDDMVGFAESDEFPWRWFQQQRFFDNTDHKKRIAHIGGYPDLCIQYPPRSVMDVAILIALIRPKKKHLIGEDWDHIKTNIWAQSPDGDNDDKSYFFKKSHAVGYALAVMVHIQLLDLT